MPKGHKESKLDQAKAVAGAVLPVAGALAASTFNVAVAVGGAAASIAQPGAGVAVGAELIGSIVS